jgi:hypothetical protein
MKKTGLLLILCLAAAAQGQNASPAANQTSPEGTVATNVNFPTEQIATPNRSDLYCSGFVNKQLLPNANFVAGGLDTPTTAQYSDSREVLYLTGKGYEVGKLYSVVRELRDPNRYEMFTGQDAMLKAMGYPYADLATVKIIDTRNKMAIAHIELACSPVVPGDTVIPYVDKSTVTFHPPMHFDRFIPASNKLSGRIVMAKDFDSELGTGMKVYMNLGANQGVKVGDYFRAVRSYEADLHNPVDSLSFKASTAEDTQAKQPSIDQKMFTKTNGPIIHVADFPRRAVGEIVVVSTTATTSTGMIVFALEDVHLGDGVELDQQSAAQ